MKNDKFKVTKIQLLAVANLLERLDALNKKGLLSVRNMIILYHSRTPEKIYVKYEKASVDADSFGFEHILVSFDREGNAESIREKFADIYAESAFLSECKDVNMDNLKQYLID